ncbi:MAG: PQQ-dependent sugar dehydrogenase [Akkermansiaceae bacterium]
MQGGQRAMTLVTTGFLWTSKFLSGEETGFPPAKDYLVETVAMDLSNPMEMSISGNLVFIAELHGNIKVVDLESGVTRVAAHFEVDYRKKGPKWSWDVESGVLGIAVDPEFETNQWVYVCYTRPGGESKEHDHVVSRFRYENGLINKKSEQEIIKIPALRDQDRIHEAGSLAFDPDGNLLVSSGDNQVHTRYLYSARTSTDTSVLNGKILRIKPGKEGGYSIPSGNLFPQGTPKTRPEIYVMGCRNPFRITVDQKTGFLYWGENGPADHYCGNLKNVEKNLLPLGFDEFNQAREAGFFGWPFFIGQNEPYPTYDFEEEKVIGAFDPEKPVNYLKENKGLGELPPARKPMIWYSHPPSPDFPSLGSGGASAIGGPVFYFDEEQGKGGLPKAFDHHWFIADYARGWVKMVELDDNEKMVAIKPFPAKQRFQTPINLKFNEKGQLFVLQYGKGGWDGNNGGSLLRISHEVDGGLAGPTNVAVRPFRGLAFDHPGTTSLRNHHCSACHQSEGVLVGPSWEMIVDRYAGQESRVDDLTDRIRKGSKGVWGNVYEMPGHAHLGEKEVKEMVEAIFSLDLMDHDGRGRPVKLKVLPSRRYFGAGPAELLDGVGGSEKDLKNDWLGFEGEDFEATIDLGKEISIREVGLSSCQMTSAGVFLPKSVEIEVSKDGKEFRSSAVVSHEVSQRDPNLKTVLSATMDQVNARYLRVKAVSLGTIPDWHQARGRKAWLFVDEILVNPRP